MGLDHSFHVVVEKTFSFVCSWDMVFPFLVVCNHGDGLLFVVAWASRTAVGLQRSGFPCFDLKQQVVSVCFEKRMGLKIRCSVWVE